MKKKNNGDITEDHPIKENELTPDVDRLPEDESKFSIALKRIFVIVIGLLLIFLIASYLLPGYDFFHIISGQMSSYRIENNFIDLGTHRIIFENGSYAALLGMYFSSQQQEFKACLIGYKQDSEYHVTKIEIPKTFSQTFSSVTAEPCNKEAIISLHSHPYKSCFLSLHDVRGYNHVKDANKDAIIGIICESDRFNFYGY